MFRRRTYVAIFSLTIFVIIFLVASKRDSQWTDKDLDMDNPIEYELSRILSDRTSLKYNMTASKESLEKYGRVIRHGKRPVELENKPKACFVSLVRNSDTFDIIGSIRQVEDRFNKKHGYTWVFMNDRLFEDQFIDQVIPFISGEALFVQIPPEHWGWPGWVDQTYALNEMKTLERKGVIYGGSLSYRHMCRFESGFFFRQPVLEEFDYYWRVEPGTQYYCDILDDPFEYMNRTGTKYGFTISIREYEATIKSLWKVVRGFIRKYPKYVSPSVLAKGLPFISNDNGATYNLCHFWSNFEIGDLNFLRSPEYLSFFTMLDRTGGFFYERWGDAPIHSIAAMILLGPEKIHHFNEIGYWHVPFSHCPMGNLYRERCHCNPKETFDWKWYSCTRRYYHLYGLDFPEGWNSTLDYPSDENYWDGDAPVPVFSSQSASTAE